jgi:hypothetical protein
VLKGNSAAIDGLDGVVRRGILGGRVVRVKIWRADGTIVYSDEHRLSGSRYSRSSSTTVVRPVSV